MPHCLRSDGPNEADGMTQWPQSRVGRPLSPFSSSGFASIQTYVTMISTFLPFFIFFFLNRILLFHAFWLLRISDVAGSCFQHFFHIYKDWEPSVGLFVYECTSQSFKSCAEDGGRRKRGPDSALIINSGETAAERTGTRHVVPRCTASFIKPCINIRPCKNCWKIAAQMPRKKCCFLV